MVDNGYESTVLGMPFQMEWMNLFLGRSTGKLEARG
jgi:hypothetical protein